MRKLNFMIVAAGLLATMGTISSCKKDEVSISKNKKGIVQSKNTARTVSNVEAELALKNSNNFIEYVELYLANPAVQTSSAIPTEFTDAEVVSYMENGLNFSYTKQDLELVNSTKDNYSITINKNSSFKTTIQNLASKYVTVFTHIKSVYNTIKLAKPTKY